jgi:hypothetical protein
MHLFLFFFDDLDGFIFNLFAIGVVDVFLVIDFYAWLFLLLVISGLFCLFASF